MSADDARKLFVGGLADTVGDAELRAFFEAGNFSVEHVAVPRDRETGKPRGFAFVTLTSEAEATRASQTLNNSMCGGRPLRIRPFSQEGPKRSGPDEPRPRRAPDASLFLGKLPYDITPEEVTELFASRGVVVQRVTLPLGPDGRPRGFGFASVESEAAAEDAVHKLTDLTVKGRAIVVSRAQAKTGRPDGSPLGSPLGSPSGRSDDRGSVPPPRFRDPAAPSPAREFAEASPDAAARLRPERPVVKRPEKQKRSNLAPQRGEKRERGGGGSWQKWDDEDE